MYMHDIHTLKPTSFLPPPLAHPLASNTLIAFYILAGRFQFRIARFFSAPLNASDQASLWVLVNGLLFLLIRATRFKEESYQL